MASNWSLVDNNGKVYTSTNFGSTWVTNLGVNGTWFCLAASADANRLAAVDYYTGGIYTSTNFGVTWQWPKNTSVHQHSIALFG